MALSPELLRQQHTHRHRAGEVGLRRLHGQLLVVPQGLLVAQGAESHDSDINVAPGKRLVNDLRVVGEIGGVEINDLYLGGTGGLHQGDRAVKPGRILPGSQHHLGRALGQELRDDSQADFRGAAEQ